MDKMARRKRRAKRCRGVQRKNSERIRLVVQRSGQHIYARAIKTGNSLVGDTDKVLLECSTVQKDLRSEASYGGNKKAAATVGHKVGKKLLELGIKQVQFDRSGFYYHGRVKALADAVRAEGVDL